MAIKINFDTAHNPEVPTLILAKRNGDKLGKINAESIQVSSYLNDADEITFNVYKYTDNEKDPLWDDIVDFKLVYCLQMDEWFEIKVEIDESSEIVKTVFGQQLAASELGQIMLYNIQINTENDIARDEYEMPTVLYYPEHPEASLLHRILEKAPHYSILHVDDTIIKMQRTFEFDDTSIYDAFQEIAEEIGCLFIFGENPDETTDLHRTISVYDLESTCSDCGYRGDFVDVCPECGSTDIDEGYGNDTGIFVTADELAENIQLSTDTDQIKNCFKLEAGDDMMNATIRNCNPNGSDYIWYISDAMKEDMSEELVSSLQSYDAKYETYYKTKDYKSLLNSSSVSKYNSIVNEYGTYLNEYLNNGGNQGDNATYSDYLIPSSIIGYQSLMKIYYDVIDLSIFLKSAMMPTFRMSDTTAEQEAAKLTAANISPVAAADEKTLSNMTVYTADNVVLAVAKIVADSRYKVSVSSSSFNKSSKVWTGSFTVTNYSDEDDTATSSQINVQVNADYEEFVRKKIEKALANSDEEDMSISGLFKKEGTAFADELKKYSLNRLLSFHDACQSCVDILVEQGIADNETWSTNTEGKNLYDDLYLPYRSKLQAVESEMNKRQEDIESIAGVYDEDGDITAKGLQNYIEDLVDAVQEDLDFQKHLGNTLWLEFCSFRRDDKYSNDNYISDGLSNAELINKANEFIEVAKKEIYKSAELQTSISSNLRNLLVIDKFEPLIEDFRVGNWIRVMVDDNVYKLRLIEYGIDYESLDEISVEFADEVKDKSTVRAVQDVIEQASSMATSYNAVKRQAKQGEQSRSVLNGWFENGLDATNTKIVGGADNQSQVMDSHGMLFRKFDVATNDYEPTQMKIINSTMAITDDNWETTKTAVGNYYYIDRNTGELKNAYGINAETIIGKLIIGQNITMDNDSGTMSFNEQGLSVSGITANNNTNTVTISPRNNSSIFNIKKDGKNIFSLDDDGNLVIIGNISTGKIDMTGEISGLADVALSGSYNDLINKPALKTVATTGSYNDLTNKPNLSTVATSGSYNDLTNKPNLAIVATSGKYNDLTGKPSLAAVATSGSYNDLTNKPSLKTVATSGKYTDLTGSTSESGKLLFVDTDGSVTTLSIDDLKTKLGI